MKYLLAALLIAAAPLSAQDNTIITVNDTTVVNIFDNDSTFIFVDHAASPTDSINDAVQQQFHEAAIAYMESCGCMGGGNATANITTGGIVLALIYIGIQLNGIKNKEHPISDPVEPKYGESK